MERTDYSPLPHLVAKNGVYSLLVRNEEPETQRLDEMKLLMIDHDSAHEVVVDPLGAFHLLSPPVSAVRVEDQAHRNMLPFLASRDDIAWQSRMPKDSIPAPFEGEPDALAVRDTLTLTFPNPTHAKKARLVVNMGTALWGSKMVKEMLLLRGDSVAQWYISIDEHGSEYAKLEKFNLREELYFLKLRVREGNEWVQRETIPASGPFITEDRTRPPSKESRLPLDLSHTEGDSVTIRIEPPRGFWQIDYMGLTYGKDSVLAPPTELPIKSFTAAPI